MTGLLHFLIFLCGVIATLTCIAIYGCVTSCIENYTTEKVKETLEEMKKEKDMEDFKNGNFIISDNYIEIMGVVSSMDQLPREGKRYGEAYILSTEPHNIIVWTKNTSTQKIGWIILTIKGDK